VALLDLGGSDHADHPDEAVSLEATEDGLLLVVCQGSSNELRGEAAIIVDRCPEGQGINLQGFPPKGHKGGGILHPQPADVELLAHLALSPMERLAGILLGKRPQDNPDHE
jgi:hypothetical protein